MKIQHRICKAIKRDIQEIKTIADANKSSIGFVLRPALIEATERKELFVAKASNNKILGFLNYHHRLDQQTTIYEICVQTPHRGKGIGRSLVKSVIDEAYNLGKCWVLLKCPEDLPANQFYRQIGFYHVSTISGKKRRLNVWEKGTGRCQSI